MIAFAINPIRTICRKFKCIIRTIRANVPFLYRRFCNIIFCICCNSCIDCRPRIHRLKRIIIDIVIDEFRRDCSRHIIALVEIRLDFLLLCLFANLDDDVHQLTPIQPLTRQLLAIRIGLICHACILIIANLAITTIVIRLACNAFVLMTFILCIIRAIRIRRAFNASMRRHIANLIFCIAFAVRILTALHTF